MKQKMTVHYLVLTALSFSILLSSLSTSIVNVALAQLALSFQTTMQAVQWVVLSYLMAITVLIVSVGRLGDIIGRRRLLLLGLLIFAIASGLCAIAPYLWLLMVARALQGLGAAVMLALAMALVGEVLPKEKTGSAMGLLGSMSAVGTALGPGLGGFLMTGFGWQAIFWINIPLALLTCLLVYRYVPFDQAPVKQSESGFDYAGSVLLGLSLATYAMAMTSGRGGFEWQSVALLLIASVGLIVFFHWQGRSVTPLIQVSLLRDQSLRRGLAMSALVTTVVMSSLVIGPFYLSAALNLASSQIGLVMSFGPLVAALTGLPAGRLVDRFGPVNMCITGLMLMLLGCIAFVALASYLSVLAYLFALSLITAGYALFQAANNTAIMQTSGAGQRGLVSGMLNLARNLGLITGASLMGNIFAISSAIEVSSAAPSSVAKLTTGLQITFMVGMGLIVLALVIALLTKLAQLNRVENCAH
jgi:EmrB/QacA subfamily drug resistance transporter